jgi:Asp-tRNA(Asn)/Glu-tRNA(Gln) amidotransferase A subunit family amidase
MSRTLPINIISEGVVTRTVRDTAHFVAAMEDAWRNPMLAPVGLVEGPGDRKLRIGVLTETPNGAPIDPQTQAGVDAAVPFDELMYRLTRYVVTTPLHNVAGTPGLAMPVGLSGEGLPLSVHLSGVRGGERTLLELGYQLEAELCGLRIEA